MDKGVLVRVLLIEKEHDQTEAIFATLCAAKNNIEAKLVHTFVDAENILKKFKPDLILAPSELSNISITDIVRIIESGRRIPVLLLITPDEVTKAEMYLNKKIIDYFILTKDTMLSLPHAVKRTLGLCKQKKDQPIRETALWEALEVKDAFLKELYHRVKNNFQTICSMLSLQSQHVVDEEIVNIFVASQDRVRAMALIHEQLQNSADLMTVDFSDYVESLIHGLFWSYSADRRRIRTDVQVEVNDLTMDTAIICGLIINELVSNSLKYAFPEKSRGDLWIRVKFIKDKLNQYILTVEDNGKGIPESVEFNDPETLGLQLVSIFSRDQLNGRITFDTSKGTLITLVFGKRE